VKGRCCHPQCVSPVWPEAVGPGGWCLFGLVAQGRRLLRCPAGPAVPSWAGKAAEAALPSHSRRCPVLRPNMQLWSHGAASWEQLRVGSGRDRGPVSGWELLGMGPTQGSLPGALQPGPGGRSTPEVRDRGDTEGDAQRRPQVPAVTLPSSPRAAPAADALRRSPGTWGPDAHPALLWLAGDVALLPSPPSAGVPRWAWPPCALRPAVMGS